MIHESPWFSGQITHHAIDVTRPPQPQRFLRTGLAGNAALRCLCDRAFMDVGKNVEIGSLRALFIGDVILISVERVSGLLLTVLVNTATHKRRRIPEVTYQCCFIRLAPFVRFFSLPPDFGSMYE